MVPTARVELGVESIATPLLKSAEASTVAPLFKDTVPVGVTPLAPETETVKSTDWQYAAGFADEVSAIFVGFAAAVTVYVLETGPAGL